MSAFLIYRLKAASLETAHLQTQHPAFHQNAHSHRTLPRRIDQPDIILRRHAATAINRHIAERRRLRAVSQDLQPLKAFGDHGRPLHAGAQLLVVPVICQPLQHALRPSTDCCLDPVDQLVVIDLPHFDTLNLAQRGSTPPS